MNGRPTRPDAGLNGWPVAELAATVALAVALVVAIGPVGLVVTAATAGVWLLAPTPYAIAVGHVCLFTLAPAALGPSDAFVAEAGFAAILLAGLAEGPNARAAVGAAALTATVAGLTAGVGLVTLSLWAAAAVTLLALAALGYAVHRLERVRFGLGERDEGAPNRDRRETEPDTSEGTNP